MSTAQVPVSRSKPVRILSATAAGLGSVVTLLAALSAAGVAVPVWLPIVVGGTATLIPVVVGEYVKDQVTPWEDVAAKADPATGKLYAGPAVKAIRTGKEVDLTEAGPSPYGGDRLLPSA